MRPKVFLTVVVLSIVVLTAAVLLKRPSATVDSEPSVTETTSPNAGSDSPPPAMSGFTGSVQVNPALANVAVPAADKAREEVIARQLDLLREHAASLSEDPAALAACLDALTHTESEVRQAAVEIVMTSNDTNAIPRLRQALDVVEDPREKVAILDAIEYLELPDAFDTQLPTNVVYRPGAEALPQEASARLAQPRGENQRTNRFRMRRPYPGAPVQRAERQGATADRTTTPFAPPGAANPSSPPPQ